MKKISVFALLTLFLGIGASYAEETATTDATATTAAYILADKTYVDAVFDKTHDAENITENKLDPARLYIYGNQDTIDNNISDSDAVAPGNDVRFDTLPVRSSDYSPGEFNIVEADGTTKRVEVWVAESAATTE